MASTGNRCDIDGVLNEKQESCVTQHLPSYISVEYEIQFDTDLRLPYAFHWNDIKQPNGRVATTKKARIVTIRALVKQGDTIGIYLGSDASPKFRKELLYPVKVGSNDVKVVIKTKQGHHDDVAQAKLVKKDVPTAHGDKQDQYEGALTGDIWMRFSHCYTVEEAAAILAETGDSDNGLAAAIHAVYSGNVSKQAGLTVQFQGKHSCRIGFQSSADSNCVANIKNDYSFGSQCLPRVHPKSWIALLQAARDAAVVYLEITSGWRPMTGKSPHRIGLGLDVKSVRTTDGQNVVFDKSHQKLWKNDEERLAHQEWVDSETDLEDAKRELAEARAATKKASGGGKTIAEARAKIAARAVQDAERNREEAKDAFQKKHASSVANTFEQSLLKNPMVNQLFDPIMMDINTLDKVAPAPNRLRSGNEALHGNHLHVTARDSYLLP